MRAKGDIVLLILLLMLVFRNFGFAQGYFNEITALRQAKFMEEKVLRLADAGFDFFFDPASFSADTLKIELFPFGLRADSAVIADSVSSFRQRYYGTLFLYKVYFDFLKKVKESEYIDERVKLYILRNFYITVEKYTKLKMERANFERVMRRLEQIGQVHKK